jgi:hypothetical protein
VLWNVFLRSDPRLEDWRLQSSVRDIRAALTDQPPSLSGRGVATWFFLKPEEGGAPESLWGAGFSGPDGLFANSDPTGVYLPPRVWNPRLDALIFWRLADRFYAPSPDTYIARPDPVWQRVVLTPELLYEGGPRIGYPRDSDMPAWSPVTGDYIGFARGEGQGVAAFCTEGVRWYTHLPIYEGNSHAFVRPDGNVLVANRREAWLLNGETGEPLGTAAYTIPFQEPAYHPGCGLLLFYNLDTTWRWLDETTWTEGPTLRVPEGYGTDQWHYAGTTDCGLVAVIDSGDTGLWLLTRWNADGSIRYQVTVRPPGPGIGATARPIMLQDQSTLIVWQPFELRHYGADGTELARIPVDLDRAGAGLVSPPAMAPDGTLFFLGDGLGGPRFVAMATDFTPGPLIWPNSGYNWARTNSLLPE